MMTRLLFTALLCWFAVAVPPAATQQTPQQVNGRIDVTPTLLSTAAYSSAQNVGGLIAFPLPRPASGLLQGVTAQFIGGQTGAPIVAYCFDSLPSVVTGFVDHAAFSIAAADEPKRINKVGISLSPSATTGDAPSAASLDNYAKPFNVTGTVWCAFAIGGSYTPPTTSDFHPSINFVQAQQ